MQETNKKGLSSFSLHVMAMAIMLCDHCYHAGLFGAQDWMNCVGRIGFPIFAFMAAEGCARTHDIKAYAYRLAIAAVLSEIPFDMLFARSLFYPLYQNVMWTLLASVCAIWAIQALERKRPKPYVPLLEAAAAFCACLACALFMTDYAGAGAFLVIGFYLCRGRRWYHGLGQAVCLFLVNFVMLGGYTYQIDALGLSLDFPRQGFAMLALVPIWLYDGRKGYDSTAFKYACYMFYPLHLLLLATIS